MVKNVVDTELLAAIRAVAQGRTFMDASASLGLGQYSPRPQRKDPDSGRETTQLSGREREVMGRVAQIAQELQLGVKSIETYRSRVMEKLGLTSRADLVRFALECGILAPGRPAP